MYKRFWYYLHCRKLSGDETQRMFMALLKFKFGDSSFFNFFVDILTILEYRICRIKKVFWGNILWVKLGVPESSTWDFDIIFIAANWVLGMRLSACLWHFWNSNLAIILFRFLDHPLPISITSTWPYHHKFRAASPQCTVLKFWCL